MNIGVAGPLETLSGADMHHQFDVNLIGPLALTRGVLPRLRGARGRVARHGHGEGMGDVGLDHRHLIALPLVSGLLFLRRSEVK